MVRVRANLGGPVAYPRRATVFARVSIGTRAFSLRGRVARTGVSASRVARGYPRAFIVSVEERRMFMPEVAVVAIFVARPGKEEELRQALEANVEPTRKEPGALQYDLHRDIKEPRRFIFVERWESEAALAKHGESAHIQAFRAKSQDLCEHGEVRVASKLL